MISEFLNIPSTVSEAQTSFKKRQTKNKKDIIDNYSEIKAILADSNHADLLDN